MRVRSRGKRTRVAVRSVEEQTRAPRDDSRKLQSSPSIREREGEGGETGGGGGGRSEKKDEGEDRPMGWRQGEIEELLSDQHRTEKLFPAFELLHTRAFPSDGKAAPNGNRSNFSPSTSVCVLYTPVYTSIAYADLFCMALFRSRLISIYYIYS